MALQGLKRELFELLKRDEEFRYAVIGLLGLDEIRKNIEEIWREIRNIWEEIRGIKEDIKTLWMEVKALRENQEKLWEGQEKLWMEVKALRENQEKLWGEVRALREGQEKLWMEVKALREEQEKLWRGQEKLWKEVEVLRREQERFRVTQERVARTLDRLTISVEEEAGETVPYRLYEKLGVRIELRRIFVMGEELDMYGASDDLCVFGEATVRLGVGLVRELDRKVGDITKLKPELLRPRMVKLIYTDYATPDALEEAKGRGIWVLNWKADLTPLVIHKTKGGK